MTDFSEHFYAAPDGIRTYFRRYPSHGDEQKLPVICMHGLTRNSRDFEDLAPWIAAKGRTVIAVDVRGRGKSDYDPNEDNYTPLTYANDMLGLLQHLRMDEVVAVGTSMGGLMAMVMASLKPGVIKACTLNDIGPEIDPKGLNRIAGYVGGKGIFQSWEEAGEAVRDINGVAFPNETAPEFWIAFARRICRETEDGIVFDYDKAIAKPVQAGNAAPADLWPLYDALAANPILLIRGALTDLLAESTCEKMAQRCESFRRADIPNVGHAPLLSEREALTALSEFFDDNP